MKFRVGVLKKGWIGSAHLSGTYRIVWIFDDSAYNANNKRHLDVVYCWHYSSDWRSLLETTSCRSKKSNCPGF